MKQVESSAAPEPDTTPSFTPSPESTQSAPTDTSDDGDPLDDLLGDFGASDSEPDEASGVKMANDDDLPTDFGTSVSSHSNRKRVRKVKKVKRPRKSL